MKHSSIFSTAMHRRLDRRALLRGVGGVGAAGGIAALAGCGSLSSESAE